MSEFDHFQRNFARGSLGYGSLDPRAPTEVFLDWTPEQPPTPEEPALQRFVDPELALSSRLAFINLMKCAFGATLLSLPIAFKFAGLYAGVVLLIVVIATQTYCIRLMIFCSHVFAARHGKGYLDYANVVKEAALAGGPEWVMCTSGRTLKLITNTLVFIMAFGICTVYLTFMADNLAMISETWFNWQIGRAWWMTILLLPVMALSQVRTLRMLAPVSFVCNVGFCIGLVIIVYFISSSSTNPNPPKSEQLAGLASFDTFPLAFGIAMMSFEGAVVVLSIENRVTSPEDFLKWNGPLNAAAACILALNIAFGFFGYLKTGEHVEESITLNLPTTWVYELARLLFVCAVFVSYAFLFYAPVERIEKWLERRMFRDNTTHLQHAATIVRLALVVVTYAVAMLVPRFTLAMAFIGSTFAVLITWLIPSVVYIWTLRAMGESVSCSTWLLNSLIIIVGVSGLCCGAYAAIVGIVRSWAWIW